MFVLLALLIFLIADSPDCWYSYLLLIFSAALSQIHINSDEGNQDLWCLLCWLSRLLMYIYCCYFQLQYPKHIGSDEGESVCVMLALLILLIAYICTYSWYFQPQFFKYIDSDEKNRRLWCLLCWFSWLLIIILANRCNSAPSCCSWEKMTVKLILLISYGRSEKIIP